MQNLIRVAVVDDHPMMREGIAQTFRREADIEVVGQGGSADDAVRLAEDLLPDVMLVDINMPGGGLEALKRIAVTCPAVAVLVISVRDDQQTVSAALKIGARGYVLKGVAGDELVRIVRAVTRGEAYVTPTLAARLLAEAGGGSANDADKLTGLTVREEQILALVAQGKSNKQIAGDLDLSEKTVKHYMTNLMQKLQVRNRVEAALMARRAQGGGE
ncbi:MAG: response regulator transcription factor [Hyphomicrobiaceae bacterium]|nr:response regulator transcription factor [Hyphomicrobiaceae bacterium]